MTSTYNEESCSKENDLAVLPGASQTADLLLWQGSWKATLCPRLDPWRRLCRRHWGTLLSNISTTSIVLLKSAGLKRLSLPIILAPNLASHFGWKCVLRLKLFILTSSKCLENISFQDALKRKYLKTFLKWKSAQREIQKHLPPPPFGFSFPSAKKSQFVTGPPGNLREKSEKWERGDSNKPSGPEASGLQGPMSLKAACKRPNKEPASTAAPQARETEEYTGPKTQDPNKQPAERPSRKSAPLLDSTNFMSSRFQVKSLLLSFKHHKSRDPKAARNYRLQ